MPKSGKEATLLPPPPLRTGRATFTASGSSLSNAHCGGRGTATNDGCRACSVVFANNARVGLHRVTQARASRRSGFKFSTNSCSLHHRQGVPNRKTARKSAPLPAAVMSSTISWLIQRLSRSLQPGVRLLRDPIPASRRQTLQSAFRPFCTREAAGEVGLTTFRVNHRIVKVSP